MAGELVRATVLLGAVGLVAIGVSGALAELLGRVFGVVFVPRLDRWMGRSGRSAGATIQAQ